MALTYRFEAETNLILLSGAQTVTIEERFDCVERLLTDKAMPAQAAVLINIAQVENCPCADDVKWIALLLGSLHARFRARVALVNSATDRIPLSEMIAQSVDPGIGEVRAFASENAARAWLALAQGSR